MTSNETRMMTDRVGMAAIGGLAGLSAWVLIEVVPDMVANPHLLITISAAVAGYFIILLAIVGPVTVRKAAIGAAYLALPAAVMLGWASLAFGSTEEFADSGFALIAWSVILCLGTPFVAVLMWDRRYWNSYLDLFDFSWSIVVRYAAAWLFVGVFWLVLVLSDALLSLVSITVIDFLMDQDPVPQILTGAVLGLALRVVFEMRDYLSPYLLLQLLRLLLPVFLLVMVIFVVALPFSDPTKLFAGLSPAATLMSVALGGISLISVALDKSDADATQAGWMQLAAKAMAVLLPILAALACYGIWLRVAQYGWTPHRLAATTAAIVVAAYAILYFLSVIAGGEWMCRVRVNNLWMAGVVMVLCVVWLSPLLNAEAISTRSQVARYLDGQTKAEDLALWELAHEWGNPGRVGLDHLKALTDGSHSEVQRLLAIAEEEDARHMFSRRIGDNGRDAKIEKLFSMIRIIPEGHGLDAAALRYLPDYRLVPWVTDCAALNGPGCVLVLGTFDNATDERAGLLFLPSKQDTYEVISVQMQEGTLVAGRNLQDAVEGKTVKLSSETVQRLLDGDFRIAPSSKNSLWLGEIELHPEN